MKTKRTLALAIAMTLTLAACGGKGDTAPAGTPPNTPVADASEYDEYDYDEYEDADYLPQNAEQNSNNPDIFTQYTGELYAAILNGKWGYVNELDEVIFPFEYDEVNEFHDDRALIYSNTERKYGYIDKGNVFLGATHTALPLYTYTGAADFKDGLAAVQTDGKWGFIDINGNETVPLIYEQVGLFADGLIPVKLDGYWGFVDKNGKTVIDFIYTDVSNGFSNGRIAVSINGAYGVIDTEGNYIIPLSKDIHSVGIINHPDNIYLITNGKSLFDWECNLLAESHSDVKVFSDGAIWTAGRSGYDHYAGSYDSVSLDCVIFNNGVKYNVDEIVAKSIELPILPTDQSHLSIGTIYLTTIFIVHYDRTYDSNVTWYSIEADSYEYINDYSNKGYFSGNSEKRYFNRINSNGELMLDEWVLYSWTPSEFENNIKIETEVSNAKTQAFNDALNNALQPKEYEVDRTIKDDSVVIITDASGIFYGIAAWRDGAVHIDYEPIYTKIQYDTKTNIFTLERGASTTMEVWAGPNGHCFAVDEIHIPANRFENAPDAQTDTSETIAASSYTGSFSLAGMWKSGDYIITFSDSGAVNALFFGFGGGGPDGSWAMSSQADENGHYTLSASHITGGSPVYKVRLISKDEIELYAESGIDFGAEYYHLYRQ
jgi:predicted small lipoprotein YifL